MNYYLCSEEVINWAKLANEEISKPFKSGYKHDEDENYYIAVLSDIEEVRAYYSTLPEPNDFWCREIVAGSMDVSKISVSGMRKRGVFNEIEEKIGLTAIRNIAMTLYNLSQKYNCTPIELINRI